MMMCAMPAIATAAAMIAMMPSAAAWRFRSFIFGSRSLRRQAQNAAQRIMESMRADVIGSLVALLLAAAAYLRVRGGGGFYDRDVYGMTAKTHRVYAGISLAFAAAFAAAAAWFADTATIWLYAAFVLLAVFYLTSYLRGAHEDDE
jgi:hypothetical protein